MTPPLERHGPRIATLVAGGLIAALALAATTTSTLVALGAADTSQRAYVLPEGITAIQVRATALQVTVESDDDLTGEPATAFINGTGSTAFGSLPALDIELLGTTAVITADETKRQLPPTPYAIEIQLNGLVLESIDVEVIERPVHIRASAERIRAVSWQSWAQVNVTAPGILEHLEAESLDAAYVMLPEAGGPYAVLLPDWFDENFLEEWWRSHYDLGYQTEVLRGADPVTGLGPIRGASPIDGPGVFVPTSAEAPVTIDLRGVNGTMIQVVGTEALKRLDG